MATVKLPEPRLSPEEFAAELRAYEGVEIKINYQSGLLTSYREVYKRPLGDDKPVSLLYKRLIPFFAQRNWHIKRRDGGNVMNRRTIMLTLRTGEYLRPEQRA